MEKCSVVNYESREDCFEKCAHVKSRLVYGDPSYISKPWLTVVVPTYRRANLLEQALESILSQWHVDYFWDIVVVDNEPDDGMENDTERLIRKIDNKRILYYRNSENIRPGDNFNRGFWLARGKWVTMLHDDDVLVPNALYVIRRLILAYDMQKRPLGAISAAYIHTEYDPIYNKTMFDIPKANKYLCSQPVCYKLLQVTHTHVKILSHIGGYAPTNGSTFRKSAIIEAGGINEDFGIFGDLIMLYNMENYYNVYCTTAPLGYDRWGCNISVKEENTRRLIHDHCAFREYVYKKNWCNYIIGMLFRNCHYKKFASDVIHERSVVSDEKRNLTDFDDIYNKRPNPIWYLFYKGIICQIYKFLRNGKSRIDAKKVKRMMKKAGYEAV